jgi:hypothetical protein
MINNSLLVHVYNVEQDVIREVMVRPREWDGSGRIGCDIGISNGPTHPHGIAVAYKMFLESQSSAKIIQVKQNESHNGHNHNHQDHSHNAHDHNHNGHDHNHQDHHQNGHDHNHQDHHQNGHDHNHQDLDHNNHNHHKKEIVETDKPGLPNLNNDRKIITKLQSEISNLDNPNGATDYPNTKLKDTFVSPQILKNSKEIGGSNYLPSPMNCSIDDKIVQVPYGSPSVSKTTEYPRSPSINIVEMEPEFSNEVNEYEHKL